MGREVFYKRRIADKVCQNGDAFEQSILSNDCTCREEDWECDVGFKRLKSGICTSIKKKVVTVPQVCDGTYVISSGYRKVAGDSCLNGVQYQDMQIPCQKNSKSMLMLLIAFILCLILYTIKQ